MVSGEASAWPRVVRMPWVVPVAAVLAVATFVHLGHDANAALWAAVQIVLVALAGYDFATRRLPNVVTLPVAALAIVLRALFERGSLQEIAIAGAVSFVVFFLLAIVVRGGFGMGDVKLASMLGFLLGSAVISALAIGIIAGGVVSAILLASSRATLHSSIAYGPYLAFGGAVAILAFNPPALV